MADYFVRVELFDADAEEYETLYNKMSALGFSKTMPPTGSNKKSLPTGCYVGTSANDTSTVRGRVSNAADPLSSKPAAVFVCEFSNWASFLYPDT